MATQQHNPQIRDSHSPLITLTSQVLLRYGEGSPDNIDEHAVLMFLDFANEVIDVVRRHPYFNESAIPGGLKYYVSPTEARPVSDNIMKAGLMYLYAEQQGSAKTPTLQAKFFATMNGVLWEEINGNAGSQEIQLRTVDGGTNRDLAPEVNTLTGMPTSTS